MRLLCATLLALAAAAIAARAEDGPADARFRRIEASYVREFLRRNPVMSTYLGGSGLYPELAAADGALRDWSSSALTDEARVFRQIRGELAALPPSELSPRRRIDREVALHQIDFVLHENEDRKYGQRALDTYVNEAFRGVDWYLQGMTALGRGRYGSEAEWRTVGARVSAIPAYLKTARANLEAGLKADNVPDWRMVERDGLSSSEENAKFFEQTLPGLVAERTGNASLRADLQARGAAAAAAFREFRGFVERSLASLPRRDRFALGEREYDWALRNNLNVDTTAAALFEQSWQVVEKTRAELMATARKVAEKNGLSLPWDADPRGATRAVFDRLARDHPSSDDEMVRWYHETALRLVDFARRTGLFEIPPDYKLEVTVTPPVLESSIDGAAYYPAPPFRRSGVGRFYVTPTKGDPEKLKQNNRASIADLAAHEGFPGHDWHYKVMTAFRDVISPVRWLTPGEVEGSSSMWEDSMAAEGWAHYAEHLMSEPAPGAPEGFYTPEERVYQLQGQLYRDLRVRIDTGIHTGRMSYDEAVDLFSEVVDFLPGSCRAAGTSPEKKASCESAERAIFRYSKWPTQAITYHLGKSRILDLRQRAEQLQGGATGRQRFHLLFMQQGTIPPGYFAEQLLADMAQGDATGGGTGGTTGGTVNSADGVPIRYEVRGSGDPALVFVHCWACDRHFWDGQVDRFAKDHEVVTLDLAGHGESGRGRTRWTIEAFGEDVRAVVEKLGLRRVVLIGHSLGGPVILEAARRLPGRVVGLIPVDTLLNVEQQEKPDEIAAFLAPFRKDFRAASEAFIREWMFTPQSDPRLIEAVVASAHRTPPEIAVAILETAWSYDARPAFRTVGVPIVAVNADKFPTALEVNRRYAPQYEALIQKGMGHYLMLEDPDAFNRLLDEALGRITSAKSKR
jgi:uncharacterized protein (DUF885 family)/pimeloyl-ACP methyl ester carboxylesterase